ncbi:MAG TPA: ATP-binding protein [Stellaceae bacterium]|nr:ATP-binding protein [Stellaceae bacterium]
MSPPRILAWPSIGATIFGAFVAMALLIGAVGGYGLYVLDAASGFVVGLYDRPLMAINFDRAASLDFVEMDKELLRRESASQSEQAAIDAKVERLVRTFAEDLAVAAERSMYQDERVVIAQIDALVGRWHKLRLGDGRAVAAAQMDELAANILERFDVLAELAVGNSFVERRKVISDVAFFRQLGIAALTLALGLAIAITLLLLGRIIRPLRHAAAVADRIADGEFEAAIPAGGKDETGALLRSMTVMQANIRSMIEREKAQRRSAQNRLADALESSPEAVVLLDPEGRIVTANSQLQRFFPTVATQLEGEASIAAASARLHRLVSAVFEPTTRDDAPADPDPLWSGREFQLTDGRWLRVSRSPTREGGFCLLISDISDFKEREEHLTEARREAEAASEAKSAFLATVSHELRTPLNAVIGFSELLACQLYGSLGDPRYQEYAQSVHHAGKHLLQIINKILELSKHQAGKLELVSEPVDLVTIVDSCVAAIREQCERAGLSLVSRAPDALIGWGHRAKLQQMLMDLLANAVKFTEPGGTVTVGAGGASDGSTWLEITDTGIGMSADEIPTAFVPFGQVDSRLARRYEGSGLGLPLVKAIVDWHRGDIEIDSAPGKGTRFTVILPPPPTAATKAATAAYEAVG